MAAPYFYDTSANATPTNKEHLLTDLLDEIQSVLSEGIHPYCEEDPLGDHYVRVGPYRRKPRFDIPYKRRA